MSLSINSLNTFSFPDFPAAPSKEASGDIPLNAQASGTSLESATDKADAKLEKIKEEIKKSPVLPSTDALVEKYGITKQQAQQVLSEVCMELSTDVGGTPEQVTKTALNMYMLAEFSDSEVSETMDTEKIIKDDLAQKAAKDEKALSSEQIADKYDIPLNQAQAVLDGIDKDEDPSSSSSATVSDLSANPTYSIQNNLSGSCTISLNNGSSLALSTVSYSA